MTIPDESAFRAVMSRFATGVAVMTTVADGRPHGMTANAISSVSLDPRLVLVCVARKTIMWQRLQRSGVFALSVLAASQADLSDRFADRELAETTEQFAGVAWSPGPVTGSPVIAGTLAHLDCRAWATYDGGDHIIVCGEVADLGIAADTDPLVFFRGAYTSTRA